MTSEPVRRASSRKAKEKIQATIDLSSDDDIAVNEGDDAKEFKLTEDPEKGANDDDFDEAASEHSEPDFKSSEDEYNDIILDKPKKGTISRKRKNETSAGDKTKKPATKKQKKETTKNTTNTTTNIATETKDSNGYNSEDEFDIPSTKKITKKIVTTTSTATTADKNKTKKSTPTGDVNSAIILDETALEKVSLGKPTSQENRQVATSIITPIMKKDTTNSPLAQITSTTKTEQKSVTSVTSKKINTEDTKMTETDHYEEISKNDNNYTDMNDEKGDENDTYNDDSGEAKPRKRKAPPAKVTITPTEPKLQNTTIKTTITSAKTSNSGVIKQLGGTVKTPVKVNTAFVPPKIDPAKASSITVITPKSSNSSIVSSAPSLRLGLSKKGIKPLHPNLIK